MVLQRQHPQDHSISSYNNDVIYSVGELLHVRLFVKLHSVGELLHALAGTHGSLCGVFAIQGWLLL